MAAEYADLARRYKNNVSCVLYKLYCTHARDILRSAGFATSDNIVSTNPREAPDGFEEKITVFLPWNREFYRWYPYRKIKSDDSYCIRNVHDVSDSWARKSHPCCRDSIFSGHQYLQKGSKYGKYSRDQYEEIFGRDQLPEINAHLVYPERFLFFLEWGFSHWIWGDYVYPY